jgi:hypothetical protein
MGNIEYLSEVLGRRAAVRVISWIPYKLASLPPVVKFWENEGGMVMRNIVRRIMLFVGIIPDRL